MVTVSRTGLTPDYVEMLIILKDNRGRIEEFKMITSYDIKTKKLVVRDAVEIIRETVPETDNSDIEALMDLDDLV